MESSRLQFLPLVVFILLPLTFITSYSIAVSRNDIRPFFAYISDTGTLPPESCIFGLMLNIIAVLLGAMMYIRYKQVEEYIRTRTITSTLNKMNFLSGIFGFISCLGVSIVGCFQQINILSVHVLGAFLAFEIGAIYLIFQAYFTFKMVPLFASNRIAYIRLFIGITCALLFIVTFSAGVASVSQFTGDKKKEILVWEAHHGGWTLHVVSVVSEWIMAALFDVYLITFMLDFKKLRFEGPKCGIPEDVHEIRSYHSTANRQRAQVISVSARPRTFDESDDESYA